DTGATGRTPQDPARSVSALAEGLQTVRADRNHGGWLSLSGPRGKPGLPHCPVWRQPGQQAPAGTAWLTDSPAASHLPFAADPPEQAAVPVACPAAAEPPRGGRSRPSTFRRLFFPCPVPPSTKKPTSAVTIFLARQMETPTGGRPSLFPPGRRRRPARR